MATITFAQDAQEFNSWLNDESDEEMQEALNALPKAIKERILQFGEDAESVLADISSAIDNAIEACESAAGCVEEMSSYAFSAESDLDTATSELGSL